MNLQKKVMTKKKADGDSVPI